MHTNALKQAQHFFDTYCRHQSTSLKVVEVGSYDVNGSLRSIFQNTQEYVGLDFNPGPGVDVVLSDPYQFPFDDNTFDVLVTTSCFEHSEMFWLTFLEGLRILKPHGLFYMNAPSSWMCYHQFPVDCWRFYPDSSKALETWGRRNHFPVMVLESYVATPTVLAECADFVSVFLKDQGHKDRYNNRSIDTMIPYREFFNAYRFPAKGHFTGTWNYPHFPHAMDKQHPLE